MLLTMAATYALAPRPALRVVYDLAARLRVADRSSPAEVILFGTPASEKHVALGFFREAAPGPGDSFVWARGGAELSLWFAAPADRVAVLDVAPFAGVAAQSAELTLNGQPIGRIGLREGRQRVRIALPAAAQRAGENRLRFVFAETRSPAETAAGAAAADTRELAAAFHALVIGEPDDPALDDLLLRDAPPPFGIDRTGSGLPVIVQAGPSAVHYALKVPEDAELRFTPALAPPARSAGVTVPMRITLEDERGKVRELWSGRLGAGDAARGEIAIRLPAEAGELVRLSLHVGDDASARFAWARWIAPRVMGHGAVRLMQPPSVPEAARRAAARLRDALGRANVLFVIFDAGRADRFGAYGHPRPTSPEVDRIAAEGVVFEHATTPAVYTLGAMSSIWTSQHPDRHHSEVSFSARLPADRLTLAEVLSARGIANAGFVANAVSGNAFGFDRGFAEFHELYKEHGSEATAFMKEVPQWLARHAGERFFLYLHFREPHYPYDPPPELAARFGAQDGPIRPEERRSDAWIKALNQGVRAPEPGEIEQLRGLFDANLAFADHEMGRIRATMEELDVWDDTLVIVAADHGEELYEHGWIGHNVYVYQPSVHVPLIVKLPRGVGEPGRREGLADLLDIAPTVADVFGVLGEGGTDREFHGRSLLGQLAGHDVGKPALLSRSVWDRPRYALRDERFKLIHHTQTGETSLYDLQSDPTETRDVAGEQTLQTSWLRQELHDWVLHAGGRVAAGPASGGPTEEQCENLRNLGYIDGRCE